MNQRQKSFFGVSDIRTSRSVFSCFVPRFRSIVNFETAPFISAIPKLVWGRRHCAAALKYLASAALGVWESEQVLSFPLDPRWMCGHVGLWISSAKQLHHIVPRAQAALQQPCFGAAKDLQDHQGCVIFEGYPLFWVGFQGKPKGKAPFWGVRKKRTHP